jgi:hypothetical protein
MCAGSAYGRGMDRYEVAGAGDVSAVLEDVRGGGYPLETALTVPVDFKEGRSTGISAEGRMATIRASVGPLTALLTCCGDYGLSPRHLMISRTVPPGQPRERPRRNR